MRSFFIRQAKTWDGSKGDLTFDYTPSERTQSYPGGPMSASDHILKAHVNGEYAGHMDLDEGQRGIPHGLINMVNTQPQFRGTGLARAMGQHFIDNIGIQPVHSDTQSGNGVGFAQATPEWPSFNGKIVTQGTPVKTVTPPAEQFSLFGKTAFFVRNADQSPYQGLTDSIRGALSDDLLKPEYRNRPDRMPSAGHCYAASEAAYHMLGGKAAGWTPMNIRHEGDPHWFLKHQDGTILDPTADQFQTPVPYDQARGKGFLTSQPSARAQTIINKVQSAPLQVVSRKKLMSPYFVRVAYSAPQKNNAKKYFFVRYAKEPSGDLDKWPTSNLHPSGRKGMGDIPLDQGTIEDMHSSGIGGGKRVPLKPI